MNYLLTGPPRCGKTTALERTASRLRERGLAVGGVLTREQRHDGKRVGFVCEALDTGGQAVLAHVDRAEGPAVGKYRVDISAVAELAVPAIERAVADADAVVVDEIAAMQRHSEAFLDAVEAAFEASPTVFAAIESGSDGVVGRYKNRADTSVVGVSPANREELPARLAASM